MVKKKALRTVCFIVVPDLAYLLTQRLFTAQGINVCFHHQATAVTPVVWALAILLPIAKITASRLYRRLRSQRWDTTPLMAGKTRSRRSWKRDGGLLHLRYQQMLFFSLKLLEQLSPIFAKLNKLFVQEVRCDCAELYCSILSAPLNPSFGQQWTVPTCIFQSWQSWKR